MLNLLCNIQNNVCAVVMFWATELADEQNLRGKIKAMFAGEKLNTTEGRAVLHVALRSLKSDNMEVDGVNVVPAVHAVLDKIKNFSERVRSCVTANFSRSLFQLHSFIDCS